MKQKTKKYGALLLLVFGLLLLTGNLETAMSADEKFPIRPVELIIPLPPGGGLDIVGRLVAEAMGPILGQKVVAVNIPGAGSIIGTQEIAQSRPDGYRIGVVFNTSLTTGPIVQKVKYTLDDFSYISYYRRAGLLFAVRSDFPAKTTKEFFEYARSHPGKLTYGTNGIGDVCHFAGEKIFQAMNVKIRMIPTGGAGPTLKALLGGNIDIYSQTVPPILPHIKAGTAWGVFISTAERNKKLPEVPGTSDLGFPKAAEPAWNGIVGPKGTPADRLAILEKAVQQAIQNPKIVEFFEKQGEEAVISSSKEFEEMVRSQYIANTIIAQQLGLSPK